MTNYYELQHLPVTPLWSDIESTAEEMSVVAVLVWEFLFDVRCLHRYMQGAV